MEQELILKRFNEAIRAKRLALNTISIYNSHLNHFLNWCESKNINPFEAQKYELIEYLSLNSNYYTLKQRKGALYNFYEFIANKPYLTYGLPCAKAPQRLPEYFTPQEIESIFALIINPKQRCILKVQYATALRVSEVVKIKTTDFVRKIVDGTECFDLRVIGKGDKERLLPVDQETINEIFAYWKTLKVKPNNKYLFAGQFRSCYSERSVQIVVRRAMRKLGIEKKGSSHLMRKSRASHFGQNGMNAINIKEWLGHSSLKPSLHYTGLDTNHLRAAAKEVDLKLLPLLNNSTRLRLK